MIRAALQSLYAHPGIAVVTATHRLSRRLLHEYNQRQLAGGLRSWPTPQILPWSAWLHEQWRRHAAQRRCRDILLSAYQSLRLWQTIIERDADYLINAQATARRAQQARRRVIEHQMALAERAVSQWFEADADAARWLQWHRSYEQTLAEKQWLDEAALGARLIHALADGGAQPPAAPLCMAGFDTLTPLQKTLRQYLRERGLWIEPPAPAECADELTGEVSILPCARGEDEITQAARWARARFERHWRAGDEPIGVIVARLGQRRDLVVRAFQEAFYPADGIASAPDILLHGSGTRLQAVFNLSSGRPLQREPMVGAALDILSLCRRRFPYAGLSRVLRSAFIADGAARRSRRSFLDFALRRRAALETSVDEMLGAWPDGEDDFGDKLRHLAAMRAEWRGAARGYARSHEWVERFQACLRLFGWPGPGEAAWHGNGDEGGDEDARKQWRSYRRQVMESLDEVWFEFSRLDAIHGPMTLTRALGDFTAMLQQHVFQTGGGEAPVQIIDVDESVGLSFSALWVLGMTEQNWPAPANPNPFIPLRLQRERQLPHCSPHWQYAYAARQTRRWRHAARRVVLSYPRMEGEAEQTPSPLLGPLLDSLPDSLPAKPGADLADMADTRPATIESPRLTDIPDQRGPPAEAQTYTATAAALKDQSQCPFRAFVKHRLAADAPRQPSPGSEPLQRGTVVHQAMARLLPPGSDNATVAAIDADAIAAAVAKTLAGQSGLINRAIERERLQHLVEQWLEQEKRRHHFTVSGVETALDAELGGLRLRLRVDRLDRLADGSVCVIDYKTGQGLSAAAWSGERPDEPQLPLYAVLQAAPVSVVAFAAVRAGACEYIGAAADKALFIAPGQAAQRVAQIPAGQAATNATPDWRAMLAAWRETLQALAAAHLAGQADIDPKHPAQKTCRHCDAMSVCRIFEHTGSIGAGSGGAR